MRVRAIATLVGVLASPAAVLVAQQPNLSGEWIFASASSDSSRGGTKSGTPTKSHATSGAAFNCGRECRIVHKGSTLTIDNAQIDSSDGAPKPAVTLQLDGRSQTVVDVFGNTIETVNRWEDGKLLITSTAYGWPLTQTVSLEQNQLVVVTTSSTGAGWKITRRYTKE